LSNHSQEKSTSQLRINRDDKIFPMPKVAILGSSGMLGSALTKVINEKDWELTEFNRAGTSITGKNKTKKFDVLNDNLFEMLHESNFDFIVNAVGIIRQLINKESSEDIELAHKVNFEFSKSLNDFSKQSKVRIIQIGTDCVFSGTAGSYKETDPFGPTDVYGATKVLGELASTESMIIRTSIIGKENFRTASLLDWIISRPEGGTVQGYVNHLWNGVTTLHFARVVSGIIDNSSFIQGTFHLVPEDKVSKLDLIKEVAHRFGRNDLNIIEFKTDQSVDLTLSTVNLETNHRFWQQGGYNEPPTIKKMVSEFAEWINKTVD
jgi:dTDP-4-dehydrorhamnose reductase